MAFVVLQSTYTDYIITTAYASMLNLQCWYLFQQLHTTCICCWQSYTCMSHYKYHTWVTYTWLIRQTQLRNLVTSLINACRWKHSTFVAFHLCNILVCHSIVSVTSSQWHGHPANFVNSTFDLQGLQIWRYNSLWDEIDAVHQRACR